MIEIVDNTTKSVGTKAEKELEFSTNTFVLSSEASSGLAKGIDIPDWLNDAITSRLQSGTSSFSDAINDINLFINQLQEGVNQSIQSVRTELESSNTDLYSNISRLDANTAANLQIINTKVTDTEARVSSLDVLEANFNTVASRADSYVVQQNAVLSNAVSSEVTRTDGLTASYTDLQNEVGGNAQIVNTGYATVGLNPDGTLNAGAGELGIIHANVGGLEARITTEEGVSAGYFHEWDGTETVRIGMVHTEPDGTVYQYYGGAWNEGYEIGWKRLDKAANDAASVVAASLLTTTNELQNQIDGAITTWFDDGAPEFLDTDGKYISTNTSADLATNDLVWDVRSGSGQMYKYNGTDATAVDLTAITFATDTDYTAVYKVVLDEAQWYTDDNIDVSNGYVWYDSSNYIQPVLDITKPVTNLIRANHIGDLYYDKLTGFAYRFSYEDLPSDTPDRGVYYSWILITDVNVTKALADAARAQDTADGKRTIYYLATPPTTGIQIGDMNVNPATKVVTMWDGSAWVDTTNTVANQAHGWAGGASKLITDPNTGAVTGWGFADGTGVQSTFKINADKFILEDSANATVPFLEIDNVAHTAKFNGVVTFGSSQVNSTMGWGTNPPVAGADVTSANTAADTAKVAGTAASTVVSTANTAYSTANTANSTSNAALVAHVFAPNTTTIDGGKITTGKIQSADANTYFDLANNQIKMYTKNADGTDKFVLDSTAAGTNAAPNIKGAYIKGGTLESVNMVSTDGMFSISSQGNIQASKLYLRNSYGFLCASAFKRYLNYVNFTPTVQLHPDDGSVARAVLLNIDGQLITSTKFGRLCDTYMVLYQYEANVVNLSGTLTLQVKVYDTKNTSTTFIQVIPIGSTYTSDGYIKASGSLDLTNTVVEGSLAVQTIVSTTDTCDFVENYIKLTVVNFDTDYPD